MKRILTALTVLAVVGMLGAGLVSAQPTNYRTHLTGDEEVPPNDSQAQGQAIFKLSPNGTELHYKLIVANVENVVAAHIHLGEVGVNGDVVAFLYGPVGPAGGRINGVIETGTITAGDVIGPLAGDFDALIEAIEAGRTYVNVHTNDGDAATGPAPGDIPAGEIRGQID